MPKFHRNLAFSKTFQLIFTKLNHITYGGGGLFGPDHQIIDHNSKTALSSTSKLGDFLILSIRHILAEFWQIYIPGGGLLQLVLK